MRNAITDRDLLIEYFKYIQDQTRVYESVTRSMNDSHIQTVSILESYFSSTREAIRQIRPSLTPNSPTEQSRRNGPRNEILERTANIINDTSSNNIVSLSDISSLIRVLRENIRLLEEQNINRFGRGVINTRPDETNTRPREALERESTAALESILLGSLNRRRPVPPVVTFSTVTNERVIRGNGYRPVNTDENAPNNSNTIRENNISTIPDSLSQSRENITINNENNSPGEFRNNSLNNENNAEAPPINSIYQGTITPRGRSTTIIDPPIRRRPRPRSLVRRTINFFETSDPLISPGNLDSPVRVRPSRTQIRTGTTLLTAMGDISGNNQTRCPIDLNDFVEGDSLLQIIGCGHIFREMNLRNHFRYSPTCPMCRYDIRDYVPNANSSDNNELNDVNFNDNTMRV
jgi:hypothetical protein